MQLINRYLLKNLILAAAFVATVLTLVVWLTQSLRFLELIVSTGAPFMTFVELALMTVPRFLELVLPISLMVAILFVYNKAIMDSEMVVLRAAGVSQAALARPGIVLALGSMVLMMFLSFWLAPVSQATMLQKREIVQAEFSSLLLREGVFNNISEGLTVYIRNRDDEGVLHGLLIHDGRSDPDNPVTITARRGRLLNTGEYPTVVVYDGNRSKFDRNEQALSRLNFDRYTLEVTDIGRKAKQRWKEPAERTLPELFKPDMTNERDVKHYRSFGAEAHRRISSTFMTLTFALTGLCCLLLGPLNRQGQTKRILLAAGLGIGLQGATLALANSARVYDWACVMMYVNAFVPMLVCMYLLSPYSEGQRRKFARMFRHKDADGETDAGADVSGGVKT